MKNLKVWMLAAILMLCGTMMLTSCSDDDETALPKNYYLDCLKKDYATVLGRVPAAEGHFVEAQYELNGKVSEFLAKDIRVVNVTYVYNLGWDEDLNEAMIIYHERDFKEGSTPMITMYNSRTPWIGDKWIPNFDGFISLEDAIANVKASQYDDPETRYVTLRHPVMEFDCGHALYVFGGSPTRQKHIFVDAISGVVYELDDSEKDE